MIDAIRPAETRDEARRRRVTYYNRWQLDLVMRNGGVREDAGRESVEMPATEREPEDPHDILAMLNPAGCTAPELDVELWNQSAAQASARAPAPQLGQRYVIHDEGGQPKTDGAVRDAWEGAKKRADLSHMPYTIKDIRAKAMTDAKKRGYDIEALQAAGAHAARETTEIHIKSREVPLSTVRMALPAA